jgi:hypothetical protein
MEAMVKHPEIPKPPSQRRRRSRSDPLNLDNPSNDAAWATVAGWCRLSSMSSALTYQALSRGDLRAKKLGRRTLIDVQRGLAWIESQPDAEIRWTKYPRRSSLMDVDAGIATRDQVEALPDA